MCVSHRRNRGIPRWLRCLTVLALLADVLSLVLVVLVVLLASLVLRCCRVAGWRGGDDAERKTQEHL